MNNNRNNAQEYILSRNSDAKAQTMGVDKPIFIVEKEADANSIIASEGKAVALEDKANIKLLLKLLAGPRPTVPPIIIAMNPSSSPKWMPFREEAMRLANELKKLDATYCNVDIVSPYNDVSAAYKADSDKFKVTVNKAETVAREAKLKADAEKLAELKKGAAGNYIEAFEQKIKDSKNAPFTATGYPDLDKILGGGLHSGLYIVGAISSLGKTTFCLQMADQIAKQGKDVCVFSLEMAREELMAKSISRLTFTLDRERHDGSYANAKTTLGILKGQYYDSYTSSELSLIQDAFYDYSKFADHIYIVEGEGNIGVNQIRETVAQHTKITGQAPVVIVDYLQLLAPTDPRSSDKQNTDKAVLELKRISRDFDVPVVAISSLNRENYNASINMAAFKESGAIEYSSDVLIGLQYDGMEANNGSVGKNVSEIMDEANKKAAQGQAVAIQAKILKYRNGSRGSVYLDFYPMFNCFEAHLEIPQEWSRSKSKYSR